MKFTNTLHSIKRVVCGVSGGVDSAVAALILKLKGYEVIGLFMKNWDDVNEHGVCSSDKDREDAKWVCDHLGIPFHEVNFVKDYWNSVFSSFLKDLQRGRTPNPDVLCNKYIKFDVFHKYAMETLGADAIATGHYARTNVGYDLESVDPKEYYGVDLLKAVDPFKCQTLFLSQVSQTSLRRALFPIGGLIKDHVKELAVQFGMERIAKRKESVGICFIGKRVFQNFIEEYIEPQPGNFVDITTGKVIGQHKGAHCWTLGQRILIGGLSHAMFVAEKNTDTGEIFVAPGTDHPALFMQTFCTEEPHWINRPPRELLTEQMFDSELKYQHVMLNKEPLYCTGTLSGENSLIVSLNRPMRSVCAGQYAVFYRDNVCLGSAKICRSGPSLYQLGHKEPIER